MASRTYRSSHEGRGCVVALIVKTRNTSPFSKPLDVVLLAGMGNGVSGAARSVLSICMGGAYGIRMVMAR